VRCYVQLLEECTIRTLSQVGIKGIRTENPGVWVDAETKIAALGVHLRRNVTSYGVGLNVETDLRWFDRITACGLEGKRVTSVREQLGLVAEKSGKGGAEGEGEGADGEGDGDGRRVGKQRLRMSALKETKEMSVMRVITELWAREFAYGLYAKRTVRLVPEIVKRDILRQLKGEAATEEGISEK